MNHSIEHIPSKTLIKLVKERPALWQGKKKATHYFEREACWKEIVRALLPNFDEMDSMTQKAYTIKVAKRWHNIRDSYKKSLRAPRSKSYMYSKLLTFLNETLPYKRKHTTHDEYYESEDNDTNESFKIDKEDTDSINEIENDSDTKLSMNEVFLEPEFNVDNQMDTKDPVEKNKGEISKDMDIANIAVFTKLLAREQDEDRAFFNSIIPSVKKFDDDLKLEFRMEVMKALKQCRDKAKAT